jgi:hypothetical protein
MEEKHTKKKDRYMKLKGKSPLGRPTLKWKQLNEGRKEEQRKK